MIEGNVHKHKPRCYDSLRDLSSIRGIVPTWLPLHKRQEFETLVFYFICRDISEKLLFTSAILVAPVFDNLYKVPTELSFHFKTKVIKRDFFILKFNDTKNYIAKFARVHFL